MMRIVELFGIDPSKKLFVLFWKYIEINLGNVCFSLYVETYMRKIN